MNTLHTSKSPYLLQHAKNPVYWQSWSNQLLEQTKKEDKLLIISIGYSSCHWCHVMETECFENHDVAKVMNEYFSSIKIDREEHPEIDALYMKALQLMTQHGGWPLNIVALPDGRPIWGTTYLPKEQWIENLKQLHNLYVTNKEKVLDYAQQLQESVADLGLIHNIDENPKLNLNELVNNRSKYLDYQFGGSIQAPKFMMPAELDFIQNYAHTTKNEKLLNYLDTTLTKMAHGGLFDVIHGGFSRYSTDHQWHIPHFEKMLYDNALLLKTYADAFKRTKNKLYRDVLEKTIKFLESDLKSFSGGYFCALDADSFNKNNIKEEGAFYVWEKQELQQILKGDFLLFSQVFNINKLGHWEDEKYVLYQNENLQILAKENNISEEFLKNKKSFWENLLFEQRKKRPQPSLDSKILTSWNAMLLSGFIHANSVLEDKNLELSIDKLTSFIENNLTQSEYFLAHTFDEEVYLDGLLEDYAFTVEAFLNLYFLKQNHYYLQTAEKYTLNAIDLFYDSSKKLFRAHKKNPLLFAWHYEIQDNVIPSGNSVMCQNLFLLGFLTKNTYFSSLADKLLKVVFPNIDYASLYPKWLENYFIQKEHFKEILFTGENAQSFLSNYRKEYHPNFIFEANENEQTLTFSFCTLNTCSAPTSDFKLLNDILSL